MRQALTRLIPFLAAATLALGAFAQEPKEDPIKQLKLTEAQVKSFISAQPDLATVAPKLQEARRQHRARRCRPSSTASPRSTALRASMSSTASPPTSRSSWPGSIPRSGEFTEPVEALKKELSDVTADASIPDADKKQLMQELTEAISTTPRLEHIENVELVKAHRAEIEKALQ